MGFWAFFDFCLLAAGVISVVFSVVYRQKNILLNLAISEADLTGAFQFMCGSRILLKHYIAALVLGIMLIITFVVSIGAIVQKNHVTIGLVILNYILVADAIAVLCIGSFVWFYTLRQRNNFHPLYVALPDTSVAFIQDKVSFRWLYPHSTSCSLSCSLAAAAISTVLIELCNHNSVQRLRLPLPMLSTPPMFTIRPHSVLKGSLALPTTH